MLPNMCYAGVMVHGQWPIVYHFPNGFFQDLDIVVIDSERSMTNSVLTQSTVDWVEATTETT